MASRGREVHRGKLLLKLKKGSMKKRVVAAFCGLPGNSEGGKAVSAQIQIFEDYEKIEKPGYKPKGTIKLDGAKIESSYTTPPNSSNNSPAYAATLLTTHGNANFSSSPISGSGSQAGSMPSSSNSEATYAFTVFTSSGETHELRTDSENDRLKWVKLLQLLVMYPLSPIPEEPKVNPIKDSFRQTLEAKQYNANSVWPVYILPEEVGQKCGIIGQHILALRSEIPNVTMGQLEIISPTDHTHPVVTWDRDKMRRTGKTGHLVFLEIGRRCEGGPGLVWMYTGYQNDAQALRETLHRFLFQGDGSAVAMNSQSQMSLYDNPRASMESQPASLQKRGSMSNYHNHLLRKNSQDQDSGYHSVSGTPTILGNGPPVRLDKHPSFRQKRDSEVSMRSYSNASSPPYGSYQDSELFDCEAAFDGTEGPTTGHMDGMGDAGNSHHQYDRVQLPRQHSSHSHYQALAPGGDAYQEDGEDQYMTMMSRSGNLKDGNYVFMRSASFSESSSPSVPVPMPQAGGMAAEYNTLQHFPANQRPSSRQLANSLNYETLPTITETKKVPIPSRNGYYDVPVPSRGTNYENHPLPQDLHGVAPRNYRPSYENRDVASFRGQRSASGQENYENVGHEVNAVNANGNNSNNNHQPSRRPSMRRRASEREEVSFVNGRRSSSGSPHSLSSSAERQRQPIVGH